MEMYEANTHAPKVFTTSSQKLVSSFFLKSCSGFPLSCFFHLGRGFPWRTFRRVEVNKIEKIERIRQNMENPSCVTSRCLNLLTWISEAGRFSRSSQSTMSKSPDRPPPARKTKPMKIPGSICLPNCGSRASSFEDMGLWLTLAPNKIKGPSNFAPHSFSYAVLRPSCRARCANSNKQDA